MFNNYTDYLLSKQISASPKGFDIDLSDVNPILFDWQKQGLQWLLKIGKGTMGWKMGLGKTFAEVEFARLVHKKTNGRVLIVCPLAVAKQTIREAAKLGVSIEYVKTIEDVRLADSPITIVNFDRFRNPKAGFEPKWFDALIIDESSILSSYQGITKKFIIPFMQATKYGLCGTGTPARNDYMELGNHAEACDVMPSNQMLANWFMAGGGKVFSGEIIAGKYKLKPLGEEDFWRWITTWALIVDTPSVIGGDDTGYLLPELDLRFHTLEVDHTRAWDMTTKKGQHYLFLPDSPSSTQMWKEKNYTFQDRVHKAIEIIENEPDEYRIHWTDMNDESKYLYEQVVTKFGKDSVVEVRGDDNIDDKEAKLDDFSLGNVRYIITKSKIAGLGLNWQHCARQTFVSINYSWEKWSQSIARSQRFGQKRQVIIDHIAMETEQGIIKTLKHKNKQDVEMHKWIKRIYDKFGLWRTDRKELTADFGEMDMTLPKWLNGSSENV